MKFGAHCYLFTQRWSNRSLEMLPHMRDAGLSALEIAVGEDVSFDPGRLRQRALDLDMAIILSPGGEWPQHCALDSDDADARRRALRWHRKQIELAGECGAVAYTGAIYGRPGNVAPHRPTDEEYDRIAQALHELADTAAAHGLTIALEPMSRFRTHLVNRPRDAVKLVQMANHQNLAVLLDTYHMVVEVRDYEDAFLAAQDHLWGVHACENDRGIPGGGLVPWDQVARALERMHFDGYVMLESYNTSIGDFAARNGVFQDVCPDGWNFARRGIDFLRRKLR